MRIAILGATSEIAMDFVRSLSKSEDHELVLFARRPANVLNWQTRIGIANRYAVHDFATLSTLVKFDALINFIGVGNPAQALAMGSSIFEVTYQYDELALSYLRLNPDCRYIFLSSGAAYGTTFEKPVDSNSHATFKLSGLCPQDWYGVAKFHAECRHRAHSSLSITDLRVFNYFSHTQNMNARFLITDILRAIKDGNVLNVSSDYVVRDYLHPSDFHQLINAVIGVTQNLAIDCYSKAPIDKPTLLEAMRNEFGLLYQTAPTKKSINATGLKPNYFSLNHRAADFGYKPYFSSLEGVVAESRLVLESEASTTARNV